MQGLGFRIQGLRCGVVFRVHMVKGSESMVRGVSSPLGRVNHCSLHCRLAKCRGLMRRVNYGAVIGRWGPAFRKQ